MGVLYIYNSLSKKKEKFEPLEYPFVKIYHCGITPYDRSHVGHLRSETSVDVLRRTLRFLGYVDIAISNFTDIDDKIIRKARETEKDWSEIAIENIKYHLKIVSRINNLPFYVNPKVTE
ncbi:MAG: cysteine--tRNA ligase, partial [Nanopusillaceae archaeon]